jgi:hypothetical protein
MNKVVVEDFLYRQGDAPVCEDGFIMESPVYFGVLDGVSEAHLPEEKPKLIEGQTFGQFASHVIAKRFAEAQRGEPLWDITKEADWFLRDSIELAKLNLSQSENLPSASFCVSQINEKEIRILQGGDSLMVYRTKDGRYRGIENQRFAIENFLVETIKKLMEKHADPKIDLDTIRNEKMWPEFLPILVETRRKYVNRPGGYAMINGQRKFQALVKEVSLEREKIDSIIFFTDGLVPLEWTGNSEMLASCVFSAYEEGGLRKILDITDRRAEKDAKDRHITLPEATAIALRF